MEEQRFCPNCGQPVQTGDVFCANCGQSLKATAQNDQQSASASQPDTSQTRESVQMTPTPQPPKKHKVWPWLVLVGVLIIAGGGGWAVANSVTHDPVKSTASSASSKGHVKVKEAGSNADQSNSANSTSNSDNDNSSASTSSASSSKSGNKVISGDAANNINKDFYSWAIDRAKMGNMAISTWYFDHGSAGQGDWYAITPDGRVQVQDNNEPGKSGFKIHSVGGAVFFHSKDGTTGDDDSTLRSGSFADNYTTDMNFNKPVSKYMLGDNGVVYELQTGNGKDVSTNSGFGEASDSGSMNDKDITDHFIVSKDTAAQTELKVLIKQYAGNN